MSLHNEIEFENDICAHLAANGWLYAEKDAADYDRELALFPEDVIAWVRETQADVWEVLCKNQGDAAGRTLLRRLRDSLNQSGTLTVLRQGFDLLGVRSKIRMAQFKPALAMNPDITRRYKANRLRVVRQVHYSIQNELNIDLVLFLNGIPFATAELKTDFTQSIDDAVDQYRFDRLPKQKGCSAEPLLAFNSGALVHFAVSSSAVMMTTRLSGPKTRFLPFNRGDNGAAGNPVNPNGHKTAYLWENVWQRHSWLDILGRYLLAEKDTKNRLKTIIFPRFHQLKATRRLSAAVFREGAGGKYLIQHSAGSGKTNSIAWTAHFFSDLHDAHDQKIFDSVIVVSDRNVIDGQLREAIEQFERNKGVVATITGKSGSKSSELAEALSGDKKVVVCTIQTFPFALELVRELAATDGKQFAVIADEAHSSQSGQAASKLKQVLSAQEQAEIEDGGEISTEDMLAAQMAAKADDSGITYVAFTATPKAKTMELFGTLPHPDKPKGPDNLPEPFDVYSMRQAIEEKFILDVLENYTAYALAFKLANDGKEYDHSEVEQSEATRALMRWVRLHPYNISQKVQIVVEHYREVVADLLGGKAKAMVVVGSRIEAVRWQIAITKYIAEQGYAIGSIVAFSGEVNDKESGPEPFRESGAVLNPTLNGRDIREAFKGDAYQILLVANKFQTGFDQPLLCAMYVDKRLAGIQAVQTLSRLNRSYPGKETTFVLDFVNKPDEVLEAFKAYYTTATLEDVTDPNIVLNLRAKLDATGFYDEHEIERVVAIELDENASQKQLAAAIVPVADRLLKQFASAKEQFKGCEENGDTRGADAARDTMNALLLFRADVATYQRAYTFLSQIFDYGNTDFEKRHIFFKYLLKLLKFGREREGVDLSEVTLTHHALRNKGKQKMVLKGKEYPKIPPMSELGSSEIRDPQKAFLSEIIERLNDLFGSETTDGDQFSYARTLAEKTMESELLRKQAANNSKEQFSASPDLTSEILAAIIDSMDAQGELSKQALNSKKIQVGLKRVLLDQLGLYESLRDTGSTAP